MKRLSWTVAVLLAALGASAATIRIDPVSSTTSPGGAVDVNVSITDVTDLYAYQFDVTFNPVVVSAASVTEGSFLAAGGSTFFVPGSIDNTLGTIAFTANTLLGPVPGVSGSGTLATLRLTGIRLGVSPLTLSNIVLLDSMSGDIAATVQNGSATVVPEPGNLTIVLLAGVALAITRRLAT